MGNVPSGNIPTWSMYPVAIFPHGQCSQWQYSHLGNVPTWSMYPVAIFPHGQCTQWQYSHMVNVPSGNIPTWSMYPVAIFPHGQCSQWQCSAHEQRATADEEKGRKYDASKPGAHTQGIRTTHPVRSQQNCAKTGHGMNEVKD